MGKVEALFLFGFLAAGFLLWGLAELNWGHAMLMSLRGPAETVTVVHQPGVFGASVYGKLGVGGLLTLAFVVTLFRRGKH